MFNQVINTYVLKFFIWIFFLIPIGINAQAGFFADLGLEVGYNPNTNTVWGRYSEQCDIWWLGFDKNARNTCLCRERCYYNEEIIYDFENCLDDCEINSKENPLDFEYCLDACEVSRVRETEHCQDLCGPEPEKVHIRRNIEYQLIAAWNINPLDPLDNEVNWVVYAPFQQIINDGTLGTVNFQPGFPWPDIHNGPFNVCYGFRVRIFYQVAGTGGSSGTDPEIFFCQDEVWDCHWRG